MTDVPDDVKRHCHDVIARELLRTAERILEVASAHVQQAGEEIAFVIAKEKIKRVLPVMPGIVVPGPGANRKD